MKIILTGSLGHISKPLAEKLIEKNHTAVIVTSNPEKKRMIEALGAIAAVGSLLDVQFLTSTFTGADIVYAMVPPNFSVPDLVLYYQSIGHSYAEAIRRSGVGRVVQLSSWGAHLAEGTGVIIGSYHVEQILNTLPGVAITYLRPASFYYNLLHYISLIKNAGIMATNFGGDDKLVMVSTNDIASAAKEEIEAAPETRKVRYVASDERSCNEIATILGSAIGKPDLKWLTFTDEETKAGMMKSGIPELMASKLVELNASIRTGLIRTDYDLHKPEMGEIKIEDFAKEFAAAFNQA